MPGYKYPNIDSGATPIGSAGRTPDRKSISRERIRQEGKNKKLEPMIDHKYPTIASGATPIGSAGRAPDEKLFREERGRKFRVHELDIYSHRESGFKNPTILAIAFEGEDI
jgi:hypothetical protein